MTPTTESVESVDWSSKLANIVCCYLQLDDQDTRGPSGWFEKCQAIAEHARFALRKQGIDPATMKPIEQKELPPTDAHSEALRRSAEERMAEREAMQAYIQGEQDHSPPAPQPEVVVSERDREIAEILDIEALHGGWNHCVNKETVASRIATHMATERAEAEAAKRHAKIVVQEVAYERDKLRTQLAATEAKLREAEGRVEELTGKLANANRRIQDIKDVVRTNVREAQKALEFVVEYLQ